MVGTTLLDRYRIVELLGEGGMGLVYRAIDEQAGDSAAPVAIKVLHAAVSSSPELVARFQREATAQAMLSHPNIVELHTVGVTDEGEMFFVLEFIEGHDLATELDDGPLVPLRAVELTKQLLSGLHHAHQFGMVHRDLKPENVLLARTPGGEQVKLIDFGLVKLLTDVLGPDECQRLTRTGMVFGTPQYMSPEQIMAAPVDARSDLYAVGIMLFEMITRRQPFEHEEVTELWRAHLSDPVPTLREFGGPDHGDLDAIISTLMAKQPEQRFASAHAARRALESVIV